jgi:hypothetical protein
LGGFAYFLGHAGHFFIIKNIFVAVAMRQLQCDCQNVAVAVWLIIYFHGLFFFAFFFVVSFDNKKA